MIAHPTKKKMILNMKTKNFKIESQTPILIWWKAKIFLITIVQINIYNIRLEWVLFMIWPARCNIYQQIKKMIDHASLIMSHFVIRKFPFKIQNENICLFVVREREIHSYGRYAIAYKNWDSYFRGVYILISVNY